MSLSERETAVTAELTLVELALHVRRTLRLALPVIVARSGVLVMIAVDTAMTGRAGADQLAYLGAGMAPTVTVVLIGLGLLLGTAVMAAQSDGAGAQGECGLIWRVALMVAAGYGLIAFGLSTQGEFFLRSIGLDPALARGGGAVIGIIGYGLPAVTLFVATTFFLEGIARPLPGMLIMVAANVVNFGLNFPFIYGGLGITAMGADGAVLATTIVRWLAFFALLAYVFAMKDRDRYGITAPMTAIGILARKLLRLGFPMAIAMGVETAAFMTMTMLAGLVGAVALGGYQIAHNLLALFFMSAIGLGAATSVRVGNAVGREDPRGVRLAGLIGTGLGVVVMVVASGAFLGFSEALALIYTRDMAVIAVAVGVLHVVAWLAVFDGAQAILVSALRGVGDVWVPMALQFFSFWILAVPVGAYLAFELDYGAPGLMGGIFVGVVASTLSNGARFSIVSRRRIVRI